MLVFAINANSPTATAQTLRIQPPVLKRITEDRHTAQFISAPAKGCTRAEGPDAAYSTETDLRQFCLERYELSKRLPEILRSLEHRNCFFTRRDNYFVVETNCVPTGMEYWTFFDVRKIAARTVVLWVESAYVGSINKPPPGRNRHKVGFRVLVRKALENARAKQPP